MKPNRIVVAWLVKYVSDDGTKYYATSADPRRGLGPRKRAHRFASREEAVKWRDARCALPPVLAASAYRVSAVTRPAPVEALKPAKPAPRMVALDDVLRLIDERIANRRIIEAALIDGRLRMASYARAAANALELARDEIAKLGGAS